MRCSPVVRAAAGLKRLSPIGRTRRRGVTPRSTRHPRTSREAALLSPRNSAAHLQWTHAPHLRRNHVPHPRQNHRNRRKPRVKALAKSKLESDREVKRNRDPSETPCYLFNCNYIQIVYRRFMSEFSRHRDVSWPRSRFDRPQYQAGKSRGHDPLGLCREFQY